MNKTNLSKQISFTNSACREEASNLAVSLLFFRLAANLKHTLIFIFIIGGALLPMDGQEVDSSSSSTEIKLVEQQYRHLLELDDAILQKISEWIRSSQRPNALETETIALAGKINRAVQPVKEAYETFLSTHPNHAPARLSFASFLSDIGEEQAVLPHLQKAVEINPRLPAAWNNLANYYGHNGNGKKAFACYEKAIALNPQEPLYYHNFGAVVFLFHNEAGEYYQLTNTELFDKVLSLYKKALELDPKNFDLAEDIAQTYYGIKISNQPSKMARPQEALVAWQYAASLAPGDFEKQGIRIHLARVYLEMGNSEQAKGELNQVTLLVYQTLKEQVDKHILEFQSSQSQEN